MIDLETMGNKPNAPIVSIGAVFFEPSTGELGDEFYRVVSLKSSMDAVLFLTLTPLFGGCSKAKSQICYLR
jgi:hypothetical protein